MDTLKSYVISGYSARQIAEAENIGYSTVRYYLKKYELQTTYHFNNWNKEKVLSAMVEATSKRELLQMLGFRDTGSVYKTLDNFCSANDIVLPNYSYVYRPNKPIDELFSEQTNTKGFTLRKHMIEYFKIPYICSNTECGISEWLGNPLTLEVDHIDGNHTNNKIENLRFLCPNCHGMEPTSHRRKIK